MSKVEVNRLSDPLLPYDDQVMEDLRAELYPPENATNRQKLSLARKYLKSGKSSLSVIAAEILLGRKLSTTNIWDVFYREVAMGVASPSERFQLIINEARMHKRVDKQLKKEEEIKNRKSIR